MSIRKSAANSAILLLGFLLPFYGSAYKENSPVANIVITSSIETYRYEFNKLKGNVEIKGEINNKYTCTNYREKGYYYEFFDDQTLLDGVELYENGQKGFANTELKDYNDNDIFYSDAKVYTLDLNFPKKDWQNEVRLKKTIKDPRYFCTVYFPGSYPVAQKEINVVIPKWMNAEIKEFNFEGYEVSRKQTFSEKENADVFTYIITNLPARKSEPRQPGPSYILPHIMILSKSANLNGQEFTFFKTLADQYNWYKQLVGLCKNDATVIKPKALEIIAVAKTDTDKIKAILYWVHENIRYVAFEDGIAGFKPDEAQNVLNKKYGDCKGMANLIKQLLIAAGFDARLAWLGTNHIRYDYSTPSLCVDNHMICCVILNGKKYFLDGTESYLPFNSYAERIQGRQVLIENGNSYLLERIPATTFSQNLSEFKENLRVTDNALTGDIEYLYRGESKEQLLSSIRSSKKEMLDAQLEQYISNNNKNYLVSNMTTSDLNQVDGDLLIKFKVNNAGAVSSFGNDMYIDIDYNKSFNHLLFDSSRKNDYCFSIKYNYKTETNLEIPSGYKVSTLPSDFEFKHPDFSFSIRFTIDNNVIHYKKQLEVYNTYLKKSVFSEWNKAVDQLSSKYLDQIILSKS